MDASPAGRDPSDPLELRHAATDHATIVVVPERRLFAIDGVGPPASDGFRLASATLRAAATALRTGLHRARGLETRTGILECAWWIHPEVPPEETADAFVDRSSWHWQQMIEIPAQADDEEIAAAVDDVRRSAGREVPLIRVIQFVEGRAAQILHLGGAATEVEAVRRLYDEVRQAGLEPRGHLHELFVAAPDLVPPSRVRSILRLPILG